VQQVLDFGRLAAEFGLHHEFVGERAGGAGDHALAAGDARRIAHGTIQIERDSGIETLAAAAQHEIVADLAAAANTAIAQDASLVIDGDGQRRIVLAAG
jgi:hypothetical protein